MDIEGVDRGGGGGGGSVGGIKHQRDWPKIKRLNFLVYSDYHGHDDI